MEEVENLELKTLKLKTLKLDLLDMVSIHVNTVKNYIPYMCMYEDELKALVGLPLQEQRIRLEGIARRIIAS